MLKDLSNCIHKGRAEQDAEEILESVVQCISEIGLDGVSAIGLTNQRESTIAWSRSSGTPFCPVISEQLIAKSVPDECIQKDGLLHSHDNGRSQ